MNNREISLEELKNIELDLLLYFRDLCEEHGWLYSITGGTLLGAVRHGGFIPWDDDIDVHMPREDYNKLIQYFNNHDTKYKLLSIETDESYGYLFAKLINPNTVMVEEHANRGGSDIGVYIDIFPVDGVGNTYDEACSTFSKDAMSRELLVASNWKEFFRSKTHKWYIEPIRLCMFILSRFFNPNKLAKKIQSHQNKYCNQNSKYYTVLSGAYRKKEIMPRETYFEFTKLSFEGHDFNAYKDYDSLLNSLYGDYMILPPENKRHTHHMFNAYWKEIND